MSKKTITKKEAEKLRDKELAKPACQHCCLHRRLKATTNERVECLECGRVFTYGNSNYGGWDYKKILPVLPLPNPVTPWRDSAWSCEEEGKTVTVKHTGGTTVTLCNIGETSIDPKVSRNVN